MNLQIASDILSALSIAVNTRSLDAGGRRACARPWRAAPGDEVPSPRPYSTTSGTLPEWLLNSGAYMHWISATPLV